MPLQCEFEREPDLIRSIQNQKTLSAVDAGGGNNKYVCILRSESRSEESLLTLLRL